MPAFVKTEKDERRWSKAKSLARRTYRKLSESDDRFWALTTSIYKKLNGGTMNKSASERVLNVMRKLAYVPLTPAAEEAVSQQPSAGGGMLPQGGMPFPDPNGAAQGAAAPTMQTVPGPNGEPIDPETGFIVVDPANGIEMEPITGILFVKPTGEFMTPDGQPIPPEQAQILIEQAMQQGGAPAPVGQPPMDAGMMPGNPAGADMMNQPTVPMDPAAQIASGGPMIDPQSGLPIDPATGMFTAPTQAAPSGASAMSGGLETAMPGFEEFVDKYEKTADRQDKLNKRILHDLSGTRTDIQGVRREIQQLNDEHDTVLARLQNVLNILEQLLGGEHRINNQQL